MATQRICTIEGCDNRVLAHGWCRKHYLRWYRHSDPLGGGTFHGESERYFREVVLNYYGSECLLWPFGRNTYGYAVMGKRIVSRLVCEEEYGPPPSPRQDAAHSCGKGHLGCVSRSHLRWDTRAGNLADKIAHGTQPRGEWCNLAKLTENGVREIRRLAGSETQRSIAARFGIDQSTVSDIVRRKSWAWLD